MLITGLSTGLLNTARLSSVTKRVVTEIVLFFTKRARTTTVSAVRIYLQ